MSSFNKVIFMGHLTRDPELKYAPSGTAITSFSIAANHKYKDKDEVCFVDVTAFGKLAENVNEYLNKGDGALVDGRLQFQQWEKDGQKRSKHAIVAQSVTFTGKKGSGGGDGGGQQQSSGYQDDVPF